MYLAVTNKSEMHHSKAKNALVKNSLLRHFLLLSLPVLFVITLLKINYIWSEKNGKLFVLMLFILKTLQ
jgi:hypothetical protein